MTTRAIVLLYVLAVIVCCHNALGQTISVYQTAQNTLDRLTEKNGKTWTAGASTASSTIAINDTILYQEILGFGGAFTDTAAINFANLNPRLQQEVLESYFGDSGLRYSIGRVHMNSCDFSVYSYNFDNVENDVDLIHFDHNVTHDQRDMIPFIRAANQTAMSATGVPIKLFFTAWSPPAWMKYPVNGQQHMDGSAQPNGLNITYMQSWALYFSYFITAYKNSGVDIWALTPQNEPQNPAEWEACVYTAEYESLFIAKYLGPQLAQDHPEVRLLGFDHNRDHVYNWARILYSDSTTKNYLTGIAFHWYLSNQLYNVNKTYWLDTSKLLLATEGCNCPGVIVDDWYRAEMYGRDILADLIFHSAGWTDWNLLVDSEGGPNHVQNYCDALIVADVKKQTIYIQPSYYYMGQITRFVPRGSRRIDSLDNVHFVNVPTTQIPLIQNSYNSIIWQCNGAANQRFTYTTDTHQIQQMNASPATCLDVENSDNKNGANVQIYQCGNPNPQSNQQWSYNPNTQQLTTYLNNTLCLDIADGSIQNGANVQLWQCSSSSGSGITSNQQWVFNQTDYTIRPVSNPDSCLTSGWSAFQSAAFITPTNEISLVVMNSTPNSLDFDVTYRDNFFSTSIPPHAIQTYTWPAL